MVQPAQYAGKGSASHRCQPAARAHCCDNIILGADTRNRDTWGDDPLLPVLCSQGSPSPLLGRTWLPLSLDTHFSLCQPVCMHARRHSRLTCLTMCKELYRPGIQWHQNIRTHLNSYSEDLCMQIPDLHIINQVLSTPAAGASPSSR